MTAETPVLAYHFVGTTLRDGRPIPPNGQWLEHKGPVKICARGLHASRHVADALQYAPGNTLCLVECEGIEAEHHDKLACRRRRIIKRIDAGGLLREYARWCALQVIELWDAPEVVRQYLTTGDESLRAAAARAAAARAARAAATYAARAARAAAYAYADADAAYVAADAAATAAYAYADAAATTYATTRAAQRRRLAELVDAAFAEVAP